MCDKSKPTVASLDDAAAALAKLLQYYETVDGGSHEDYFAGGIATALEIIKGETTVDDVIDRRLAELSETYDQSDEEWLESLFASRPSAFGQVEHSTGPVSDYSEHHGVRRGRHLRSVR